MSRFHVVNKLISIPKEKLQGKVKCWDLVDANTIIVFDLSGNYLVWNIKTAEVLSRGAVKQCPKSIKVLKGGSVAMVIGDSFWVVDYGKAEEIAVIALGDYKYIESLQGTEFGCSLVSVNAQNQKKMHFYQGGKEFAKTVDLEEVGGSRAIDYLSHDEIVRYEQYYMGDAPDRTFKFEVFGYKESVSKLYDIKQELGLLSLKIGRIDPTQFLIISNQCITNPLAFIFTLGQSQQSNTLSPPIKISSNSFVDLLFIDPHLMQIGILTQSYVSILQANCVSGQNVDQCSSAVEVFDLKHQKTLSVLYFPEFSKMRYLGDEHLLAVDQASYGEEFKVRMFKFTHKNMQYLHLMEKMGVGEMYGGHEVLRAVLKLLED